MTKANVSLDAVFNNALDIVENRELYSDFLQKNFGSDWENVDIAEVQQKLLRKLKKNDS
jgi:hypothetical protein